MEELNPLKNPVEYQNKLLSLMRAYESLIGELYGIYAKKFPAQQTFWSKISEEEGLHAYWLETLSNQLGGEKIYFDEKRFDIAPLNECIDEVGIRIAEANNEPMEMLEAISVSISIENGMIERKFFEVFESDSPEIKKTFNMLKAATLQHGISVKEVWDAERKKVEKKSDGFWQKIKNFFA